MPKKTAVKLWHRARDFDRQTRQKDKDGGAFLIKHETPILAAAQLR